MTTEAIRNAGATEENPRVRLELWAIVAGVFSLLLFFALVSFRSGQPGANWIGPVGSFVADTLYFSLGAGAFGVVGLTGWLCWSIARGRPVMERTGEVVGWVLAFLAAIVLVSVLFVEARVGTHPAGGILGRALSDLLVSMIGRVGSAVLTVGGLLGAAVLISGQTLGGLWARAAAHFRESFSGTASENGEEAASAEDEVPEAAAEEVSMEEGEASVRSRWSLPRWGVFSLFGRGRVPSPEDEDAADHDAEAERARGGETALPEREATPSARVAHAPIEVGSDPAWVESFESMGAEDEDFAVSPTDDLSVVSADQGSALSARSRVCEDAPGPAEGSGSARVSIAGNAVEPGGAEGAPSVEGGVEVRPARGAALPIDEGSAARQRSLAERLRKVRYDQEDEVVEPSASSEVWYGESEELPVAEELSGPSALVASAPRDEREDPAIGPAIIESRALRERTRREDLERADVARQREAEPECAPWQFPPLRFLSYEESSASDIDRTHLESQAAQLEQVLGEFRVEGKVTGIRPGPVVTMYEFEPAAGIKVSKISGLSSDIAMALRAEQVRIIAPLPGRGCVGIEVPNEKREIVYLKEILAHDTFRNAKSKLSVSLGKDIAGEPVVANLQKMPHLLVAGTTGSGKSVAVNAFITSVLYNASPDDVRMILIDPKQLELAVYEGVPHLLLPVVTEPGKATTALNWAVMEMERRYTLMKEMKVRNLEGYNARLREQLERFGRSEGEPSGASREEAMLAEQDPDGRWRHRHMPYLLIVIDEFADLIMTAGKEVEIAVARLAQKARAAGIHVILATQRPSVDVLTGLIKANFPTRISFRLLAPQDSRTVLDTQGAESLLGQGDMLFRPPGRSDLQRVHGAWVDEREIEEVVEFLKAQREPDYDESILQVPEEGPGALGEDEEVDELYDDAVATVVSEGFASISMVQRRLRIGYNRAARILEHMEREGVIGPATGGSSRREVLVSSHD